MCQTGRKNHLPNPLLTHHSSIHQNLDHILTACLEPWHLTCPSTYRNANYKLSGKSSPHPKSKKQKKWKRLISKKISISLASHEKAKCRKQKTVSLYSLLYKKHECMSINVVWDPWSRVPPKEQLLQLAVLDSAGFGKNSDHCVCLDQWTM